jgi:glutathione S-transferase/GST-like protein
MVQQGGVEPLLGRRHGMSGIALYHWEPNANSGKPMLALMEKGVSFDSHYIDMLQFDQHKPGYLAINPQGTIPAMTHSGRGARAC